MKAFISTDGTIVPVDSVASIQKEGDMSRVYIRASFGAYGNSISDIGMHYERVNLTPRELAEKLGIVVVNQI